MDEIKKHGFSVLRRKAEKAIAILFSFSIHALLMPFVIPLVLIVRIVRPLVLVRFGSIMGQRIGHYMTDMECYFAERELGIQPDAIDFFYYDSPVCNEWLRGFYAKKVRVSRVVRSLALVNSIIPGGGAHVISIKPRDIWGSRDQEGLFLRTRPNLFFTQEEVSEGERSLRAMGIPEGAKFICFHNRDIKYLSTQTPGADWTYHQYRDSSIHTYYDAVLEMTRRGYYAVRMGAIVAEPVRLAHPMVIDYATNGMRTDFLDIYLSAKCHIFLLSSGGMSAISEVLRRPIIYVNFVPFEFVQSFTPHSLTIFKKYWSRANGRLMTFREILDSGAGAYLRTSDYVNAGIELIDNTPEEILEATTEMQERLEGTWNAEDGDEELQRRFWKLFDGSPHHNIKVARIGAMFLRRNRSLLD